MVVGTAVGAVGPMLAAVWLAHEELVWDPMLGIVQLAYQEPFEEPKLVAVWLAKKNTDEKPKLFAVRLAREDLVEKLWNLIGLNWLAMTIKRKLNKMKK